MNTLEEDLNYQYLSAELRQVDAKIQFSLRSWINAGQDSSDRFRGLYVSAQEAQRLAGMAAGADADHLESSQESSNEEVLEIIQKAEQESHHIEKVAKKKGTRLRLLHIRKYFDLSDFEYYALLICLLPALDLRYERIYGFLQDDVTKKQAGVNMILSLLVDSDMPEITRLKWLGNFSANRTLLNYRLLRPLDPTGDWQEPRLNQHFEVSPALVSYLLGQYFPEEEWLHLLELPQLQEALQGNSFAEGFAFDWQKVADNSPLISFDGPDEERQQLAAMKVAAAFNLHLLEVNLKDVCNDEPLKLADLRLMIRDACLLEAVLYIAGWEKALDSDGFVPVEVLEELSGYTGLVVLGSRISWRISNKGGGRPVFRIKFDCPSNTERLELWQQWMADETHIEPETLRNIAGQFRLTSGQIENAIFVVKNSMLQTGKIFSAEELFQAARLQSTHKLDELAQKVDPRYRWEDIILPDEEINILHNIVSMLRYQPLVLEEWGVGKKLTASSGISALFAGDPGTGKTLAAQVLAAELQLDLYRIDLSRVVSKYIGETEKNLDKIFQEAENSNAILFFDEADAIFGKRSEVKDAHDRYANIEIGYLLQRMETYNGVTILATNLRTNMDEAFTRRLNFIVTFPFPEEEQRLKIWKVLIPEKLPIEPDIDWAFLARKYPVAGGNIRNILVTAAFLAAPDHQTLSMKHLLKAVRQEMQKMGRFIKDEDYLYP